MSVELRPLTHADAVAHCAGEDDEMVRWLTGDRGTVAETCEYFDWLADNAARGSGKLGFGVWLIDRLAGYVDCDPDVRDGLVDGDVNLSYGVHPWARGRGVAVAAVGLICDVIRDNGLGGRAAIRVDPANASSVRIAEKSGFEFIREFSSPKLDADGSPLRRRLYLRDLEPCADGRDVGRWARD